MYRSSELLCDRQRDFAQVLITRRIADHDEKLSRFDDVLHVYVVERKQIRSNVERDRFLLSGSQRQLLEPFEFLDWPRDGADCIADIHLHDFGTFALAGVGYVGKNTCRSVSAN